MENEPYNIRYNVMLIGSLVAFANIKGGMYCGCKDVYFVRAIGVSPDYANEIRMIDRILLQRMLSGYGRYTRLDNLPKLSVSDDISHYTKVYDKWIDSKRSSCVLNDTSNQNELFEILSKQLNKIRNLYISFKTNSNPTIEKNFFIKILFWLDKIGKFFLKSWDKKISCKFVYAGYVKKQEFLFLYLLSLLGIDVMLLLPEGDVQIEPELLNLTQKFILGNVDKVLIPYYDINIYEKSSEKSSLSKRDNIQAREPVSISLPTVKSKSPDTQIIICDNHHARKNNSYQNSENDNSVINELQFEELALLASSVVMITQHNHNGDIIGSGSGIMIAHNGYIITNHHVAYGSKFFSVKIEDDEQIYKTDELIKYNPLIDLALIRINRQLKPIPVYKGSKKLVRGQKVVAIGSPLGLFNSVSDGIISGFRCIDDVDMIQFTAPVSHGSSGGALLDMYGEVIGISTSGIENGQNINLAVGYESINIFIQGFLK